MGTAHNIRVSGQAVVVTLALTVIVGSFFAMTNGADRTMRKAYDIVIAVSLVIVGFAIRSCMRHTTNVRHRIRLVVQAAIGFLVVGAGIIYLMRLGPVEKWGTPDCWHIGEILAAGMFAIVQPLSSHLKSDKSL